jgi:hypothetical protein
MSVNLSAQKPFAGIIKTETRAEGTDDVNITANYPQELTMTVMGNMAMLKMDPMTIIQNGEKNQLTVLLDFTVYGMGMYHKSKTMSLSKTKEYKYVTDKTDTKTILGYNCYKITGTEINLEDDEETTTIYYVSDDFLPGFKHVGEPGLIGFPLLTITEVKNITSSYSIVQEVKEIKADKKIKDTTFMLPSTAKPFSEAPDELGEVIEQMDETFFEE